LGGDDIISFMNFQRKEGAKQRARKKATSFPGSYPRSPQSPEEKRKEPGYGVGIKGAKKDKKNRREKGQEKQARKRTRMKGAKERRGARGEKIRLSRIFNKAWANSETNCGMEHH
jgi:hypothetical protein